MTLEEKIDKTLKCPHYFACLYGPDECRSCAVEYEGGEDLLLLIGQGPDLCPYRLSFGRRKICCCPTHYWIWRHSVSLPNKDGQAGFWISGPNDVIIETNPEMENILGLSRHRILGACVHTVFPGPAVDEFIPVYDRAIQAGKTLRFSNVPVVPVEGRRSYQSGWVIPKVKDQGAVFTLCIMEGGNGNGLPMRAER